MHFPLTSEGLLYLIGKSLPFPSNDPAPLALPPSWLPFLPMLCSPGTGLPRFAPAAFSPDGLCHRRVTRSAVPRCEVQVVMITPGYALAPLTGTPGPANAHENPGRSSIHLTGGVDNEATFTTFSLLSLCCSKGIASGIGADSASAASCRTGVIQYVVPHVPPLLRSFPILIVKHHEQQDVEA
ncbi:hypothetical protein L195_g021404 [Trifolium pratense]|uniref:Uncharacterized protein n=1 Tax=Trifolium pratense TaxID=57577 RepID=A0A2K3N558_TRIPR|nr:hypothetical protein L195_g021404 [Trifolium pratense]